MKHIYFKGVFLINETFIIDHSIFDDWINEFRKRYIKALKESPFVRDVVFSRVKGDHNPDGENYALQFKINEKEFDEFQADKELLEIRKSIDDKFKNQYASFVTILEIDTE